MCKDKPRTFWPLPAAAARHLFTTLKFRIVRAFEGRWVRGIEPLRLAILSRPRNGEWLPEEILSWKSAGIGLVVSMLMPSEARELGLERESELCLREGLQFVACPVPDREAPSSISAFRSSFAQANEALRSGIAVGVHCRAGIGRTGLFCACLLASSGKSVQNAFEILSSSRGVEMPDTEQQFQWVEKYASSFVSEP